MECESHFEELVRNGEQPDCPTAAPRRCAAVLRLRGPRHRRTAELQRRCRRRVLRRFLRLRSADRAGAFALEAAGCTRCRLAARRTQVVFGVGIPTPTCCSSARRRGSTRTRRVPVRPTGRKLLDRLLAGHRPRRADIFVANVFKCRPPGNRDPQPDEIAACEPHLFRQIELIRRRSSPRSATSRRSSSPARPSGSRGCTARSRRSRSARRVLLYPLYHPAAALYTPSMLRVLEEDFAGFRRSSTARSSLPCACVAPAASRRPQQPSRSRSSSASSDRGASSGAETEALAVASPRAPARRRRPVSGELGCGKTTFVRGACRALGVRRR